MSRRNLASAKFGGSRSCHSPISVQRGEPPLSRGRAAECALDDGGRVVAGELVAKRLGALAIRAAGDSPHRMSDRPRPRPLGAEVDAETSRREAHVDVVLAFELTGRDYGHAVDERMHHAARTAVADEELCDRHQRAEVDIVFDDHTRLREALAKLAGVASAG